MVNTISSSATPSLTGTDTTLAENFEQFLQILLTQLQNQNPLEPLDTNQFTQQLVQFSEVEQSLKTNDQLESIVENTSNSQNMNVVNYLGATVTADGDATQLTAGSATWKVNAPQSVDDVSVSIYNANGSLVYQGTTDLDNGENTYEWDGRDITGRPSDDGVYRVVFDAQTAFGSPVIVDTKVQGTVTGIELSGTDPILKIGDASVPLSLINTVDAVS